MRWFLKSAVAAFVFIGATSGTLQAQTQQSSPEISRVQELLEIGETLILKGQHKEALRAFSEAFKLSDDHSTRALHGLGTAYLRLSKFDKAEDCGEKLLELGKTEVWQAAAENLIGAAMLGRALDTKEEEKRRGLLADAEAHLRASLEASSGRMNIAWFNLSVALQQQGRLAEARIAQQEYVNRTTDDRAARSRLCELDYLAQDSTEESTAVTATLVKEILAEGSREVPGSPAADSSVSRESQTQTPFKVTGDVQPPEKLHSPAPPYTKEARNARIQGVVIMEAVIDSYGAVTDLKVLKGLPEGLTRSAALTACTWYFDPATLHGQPVPVYFSLTVRFSLEQRK